MCNNVSQPFIPLPLHFSPFFIMFPNSCFKCISLLYNAPFSPEIVHLLTSSHFHCFTQPLLTSSSTAFPTLLLHNSLCFWCICLCILLSYAPFFPLFVLSLSPFLRFILLLLLPGWLQQCTFQPLSAWSGCRRHCGVNGVRGSYMGSVTEWAHSTQKGRNPMR